MSDQPPAPDPLQDALAFARQLSQRLSDAASQAEVDASQATQDFLEETTQRLGQGLEPIANSRLLDVAARIPGFGWILAAVGRVNTAKIKAEVAQLRREHPAETEQELCDRLISSAAIAAGGIGLVTNIVPPIALMLFAVDIVAVATLQAEMIYRVAEVYGFDLEDSARRGEVLSIFAVSLASSSAVKAGLGLAEAIPVVGVAIGVTSNAGLIYALGNGAQQYYALKRERQS